MRTPTLQTCLDRSRQRGLSLVELLIAMALGLLLMAALGSLFVGSSRSNAELQKASQQIENGRYATEVLSNDLKHAGFYGEFSSPPAPTAIYDPCESLSLANLQAALALPVQAFRAPDLTTRADISATTCDDIGLLTDDNLALGSDVIVVRRADTAVLPVGSVAENNEVYVQANAFQAEIQFGNGAALTSTDKADGNPAVIFAKDGTTAAPVRKYHVLIYFVAPCATGSGAGGVCAAGDDTIPTLKRLELTVDGTGTRDFYIVPVASGIEYLKAEWGIDEQPATVNVTTGMAGNGVQESFVAAPTALQLSNAVSAKLHLLARNTERTGGHVDDKSYSLGAGVTLAAQNDAFKRHVFTTDVLIMNMAGRKEIPE
jgi:type IV pilus assembly protein PilW